MYRRLSMNIDIEQMRAKIQAEIDMAQKRMAKLDEFESTFKDEFGDDLVVEAPLKSAKKVAAKATKTKATKTKATKTKATKTSKNAGQEAVARGERPPFKKAIMMVLDKRTMNATQIVEALKAKKWMPESSDPRQYVSYMLSTNTPDTFQRTDKRGFYEVRPGVVAEMTKSGNGKKTKSATKAKVIKSNDPQINEKLDAMYGNGSDSNVASDPHAEAGA
jgi:hypothetical protein